jgi:type I restriction enzyme M protein
VQWIAPPAKDTATDTLEKRLWDAADQMRANSGLSPQQYSGPVLGLIFLRFAEVRFAKRRSELEKQAAGGRRGSRVDDPNAYTAEGVIFLAPEARFDFLLALPEGANIGSKVNDAMRAVERDNMQLAGVLPKARCVWTLRQLVKSLNVATDTL